MSLFFKTFSLILILTISGCGFESKKPLKLVANSWVGYTPLFYANEQGWLADNHIKLSSVVSLGESLALYENAGFDLFCGTQFEFHQAQQVFPDVMPIMLFNKSNGGDVVLSNTSIEKLQENSQTIDVYLEMNSVNYIIFKDFIRIHQLKAKSFNFINHDQLKIVSLVSRRLNNPKNVAIDVSPFLVVTYDPFNNRLLKQGLNILDSTASSHSLLVIDALFAKPDVAAHHLKQLQGLKTAIDNAIEYFKSNPEDYYEKVKGYLDNPSYAAFIRSMHTIDWMNQTPDSDLTERLRDSNFPLTGLVRP